MEISELKGYLLIILKRWWLILLATALAGSAAYYESASQTPIYQTSTTIEISPGVDSSGDIFSAADSAQKAAATYVARIRFPAILCEAADRLDLHAYECGERDIVVRQIPDTHLIQITAENTDPALAQKHADTVAEVFIERELAKQQDRYQSSLTELELQIAEVEATLAETQRAIVSLGELNYRDDAANLELALLQIELSSNQTRLSTLLRSAEDFRLAIARYTDYVSIVSPARLPNTPVRPNVMRDTMLGLAVGLMIGVGMVFLLEYLDDTIKSPDDVKRTLPVGVLGVLPVVEATNGASPGLVVEKEPRRPVAEAFRNLRTSIQFFSLDRPAKTILVTSPTPSDGKSFTAANLAISIAQGGQSVVLVDSDLRRPVLHQMFERPNRKGLVSTLLKPGEPHLQLTGTDGLRILTAGASPPNPAELLGSQRMRQLVSWLREQVDVVILDSPPLLAFADAAVLSSMADGVILVVEYGKTLRQAALRAVERLEEVGGNVLGVVINQMDSSADGHYYYYGYSSYYRKDGRDEAEKDGRRGPLTRLFLPKRKRE